MMRKIKGLKGKEEKNVVLFVCRKWEITKKKKKNKSNEYGILNRLKQLRIANCAFRYTLYVLFDCLFVFFPIRWGFFIFFFYILSILMPTYFHIFYPRINWLHTIKKRLRKRKHIRNKMLFDLFYSASLFDDPIVSIMKRENISRFGFAFTLTHPLYLSVSLSLNLFCCFASFIFSICHR